MKEKDNQTKKVFASLLAAASLSFAPHSLANPNLPRGADVGSLAGNCAIGTFSQTSKAGGYNQLCAIMEDSEKCLALIKGQFQYNGTDVKVRPFSIESQAKAQYCLSVLEDELGL